jgi:sortase A
VRENRKALIALLVLFIIAILVTVYPIVSNYLYDRHRSRVQTEYFEAIEQMDNERISLARQAAENYNALLAKGVATAFSDEQLNAAAVSYKDLLNVNGDGIMGYLEIPAIELNLPIAHGTDSKTLEKYIGHVVGTSLPIGGSGTHAVLSGHSGMASQRMFTDLHELNTGDLVLLHVLGETLAYEVESMETVLPENVSGLSIEPGEDKLTLITCTPIGVNTHRLLVHCKRVEYVQEVQDIDSQEEMVSSWQKQYLEGIGYGAAALMVGFVCYEVIRIWRAQHDKRT